MRRFKPNSSGRNRGRLLFVMGCVSACLFTERLPAATTLTVDLTTPIGAVTHVGSGSLYGVTEKLPADIDKLVAPLHPKVFTNPAADQQQPVGDAIVVAGRVAPIGARVTIRLADWFKGWPYQFTSMSDWFDKLAQTVQRKKDSGLTNFYGYEIWNEPNGTWKTSSPSFNDFWAQTYAELRRLDPGEKIVGPSLAGYDSSYLSNFLSYCKSHDVVPDIISWHELSGEPLTADLQNYRNLEKQIGIGPLPISINEYSGAGRQDDEGKPGTSAPMIAKFERFKVDSACISYWDVAHAGRLGSLLATDTAPNGGWWFYKWYGDMTGNMVTTTAPSPSNATALDGFASLSATSASVLFGGVSDGTIRLLIKGFQGSGTFGTKVHAIVERTPWANRSTVVNATTTVSTSDVDVENDQITVSVTGANSVDGFRLLLTPVGGPSTGTGGASNGGAAGSSGGAMGSGGGAGASVIAGGGGASTGGSALATGGTQNATGGTFAEGGSPARGGSSSMIPGATMGAGGAPSIGSPASAGTAGAANGASSTGREAGCSCRFASAASSGDGVVWLGVLALTRTRGRRRIRPLTGVSERSPRAPEEGEAPREGGQIRPSERPERWT